MLIDGSPREDQAETLLLQALRGAGLKGMSAMPICRPFGRGWHLRPLLDVPQSELLAFGACAAGASVIDPMNENLRFDRGYLRRRVWPLIESRWPGAAATLARTPDMRPTRRSCWIERASADVGRLRDGDALSVPGLRAMSARETDQCPSILAVRCQCRARRRLRA